MARPLSREATTVVVTAVHIYLLVLRFSSLVNEALTSQATRAARAATASTKLFPFDQ